MKKNAFLTKSEIIYQEIKEDIINGRYKPEERIIISEIAKAMGTSDIPVREAMRHLESDGLIQNKPYVGSIVTDFDLTDIQKIYRIRTVLEGMATRDAVLKIKEKDLKKLNTILNKMNRDAGSENYATLSNLNREFHRIIYDACDNAYLTRMIFELWDMSLRARAIFSFRPKRAQEAIEEHLQIAAAIEKKDEELAENLMVQHMESHLKALKLFYENEN